ncbi:MAG TPA: squalene synthase HpnC [Acidimicrobiia bacterium]|nr:squalene synthase HpnC [Acidimicrobiia bacterium]
MPEPQAQLARPDTFERRAAQENFPVALRVLPRRVRTHLSAVYAFARLTDDLGDEGDASPAERLAALDRLDAGLDAVFAGEPADPPADPVLARLVPTVRACALPEEPFRRLVEANRIDQRVHRYATWAELREYCAYSADPVGRLVLAVFGASTPGREALSDDVCTALQLVEHVQDIGEDFARGRVYVPAEDLDRFGCTDADLAGAPASPALRRVAVFESDRARVLLRSGAELVAELSGNARLAVAGFVAGGLATLDAFAAADHDVLSEPRRPARTRVARHVAALLTRARVQSRSAAA